MNSKQNLHTLPADFDVDSIRVLPLYIKRGEILYENPQEKVNFCVEKFHRMWIRFGKVLYCLEL